MNKYKTVFLDWNKTLSQSKFWGHLQDSDSENGSLFKQVEEVLFGQTREVVNPWMRGEYQSEDICQIIADKSKLDYETVFTEFVRSCELMTLSSPEIPRLIEQIKATGATVVIATDNMDSFSRWTWPKLQMDHQGLFDGLLCSYELRALKEDLSEEGVSLFFDQYHQDKNLTYGESVLIDDSPDRRGVFSQIGLDYLQVPTEEEFIASLKRLTNNIGS